MCSELGGNQLTGAIPDLGSLWNLHELCVPMALAMCACESAERHASCGGDACSGAAQPLWL
jgi:hypothetical protein